MRLVEACEPVFACVCRLNRSARKGVSPPGGIDQVRAEVKQALDQSAARAQSAGLKGPFDQIEIVLLYFVDWAIKTSRLPMASKWRELAVERGKPGGDEDFFDQLEQTLGESISGSEGSNERLGIFYVCMGLGFTGWYAGQPDYLRKKMTEMSSRLRGMMDADRSSRVTPEAYEHVNTSDLVEPPARKVAGVSIALAGLALAVMVANAVLFREKRAELGTALEAIKEQAKTGKPSGTGSVAGQGVKP